MRYPELPETLLKLEEECLERWRQEDLFQRTLDATADGEPFVFYEGPPTANGRPGLHHIISRTIKDLVCRYQTMLGRSVTRIAGWDTHGLPVEIEAEAKLGISGKPEIEAMGIERFNQVCRESVFTYKEEWEELSERIGYWLDYSRPYVTFQSDYIESVWWVLKQLANKGLLYRGHKSVPYCPRCGTALSSHEVAQGYEEIEDASLFFLCPVLSEAGDPDPDGRAFLVWTTTPWTVPSNVGLAVHPYLTYVEVGHDGRRLILAEDRVQEILGEDAEILARCMGRELVGTRYARPLDIVEVPAEVGAAWTVIPEEFVSAEEGTGLVHLAPAFGADDYAAGQKHDLPMLRPVDDAGKFVEGTPVVGGMFVKDADPHLVDALEEMGNLFRSGRHVHSYPHCWRCRSPLIYMARDSWFAATSSLKERMVEHNSRVNWLPPEVGTGRFGEWLENNVDWALSRDRYWGTPLPVWICDQDEEHVEWIGSLAELEERAGPLGEDFDPHRPFIDEVRWGCSQCDGTMRRSPVVIDVWFDSGCMPYAQWHYPFENQEEWARHFPADFICEGLDQTRGWFYSLMAISTMLGLDPAFRNVVVNGLILDSNGLKMSKSRGNAVDPWQAIADHGADAVRWYLITGSNPWAAKRFDNEVVKELVRKHFDTLFNTYRFFSLYANVEEWTPAEFGSDPDDRSLLDRWILSRLSSLVKTVDEELSAYQITRAYRAVSEFLDEDLSNWYVRRSRARFWGNADASDAQAAFQTLWEALHTVSLLISPVTPFTGDWLHRAVAGQSAHLSRFPHTRAELIDPGLEGEMYSVRTLARLGRAAREKVQIRVRQPLRALHAVVPRGLEIRSELLAVLSEELNVKEVHFLESTEGLTALSARPNFRELGPRFQKSAEQAAQAIRALSQEALERFKRGESVSIVVDGEESALEQGELEVVEEARSGFVVQSEGDHTAALDPELDDDLRQEGLARELVNRIQRLRRDSGLEITDRIRIGIVGAEAIEVAARRFQDFISGETLATTFLIGEAEVETGYEHSREVELDGEKMRVSLEVA